MNEPKVDARKKRLLRYDESKWTESFTEPINTLQLFITNRCNLRCEGCFYRKKLGKEDMSLEDYQDNLFRYYSEIQKVILLGGEPTLHRNLKEMLSLNRGFGLRTTIYTNGANLKSLENFDLRDVSVRIGVYGAFKSEKPLSKVERTNIPVDMVYMLRKDNISELIKTAEIAEKEFNCRGFYISSIREIDKTGSFWEDTEETLPIQEYGEVIQDFLNNYTGNIPVLHIARRVILYTGNYQESVDKCRFGNIFPNDQKIICPLDISRNITSKELSFNERKCNKNHECVLRKIVLKRR